MGPIEIAVSRLAASLGNPKTDDPEQFLVEFARALAGTDEGILQEATTRMITKSVFFPRPAEMLEMISRVAANRQREKELRRLPPPEPQEPSPEARARAKILVDEMLEAVRSRSREVGFDAEPLKEGQRPAFEAMQRNSPNSLHRSRS